MMTTDRLHYVLVFSVLSFTSLTLFSCSPTLFVGELSDYEQEIQELQARLFDDPQDAEALRDLGAIYLRARQFGQANSYLEQAFTLDPDDPKTLFNLGLANETLAKRDTALRLYEKFVDVPRISPYRRMMEGRYEWLSRRILRDQVQRMADTGPEVDAPVSPRIVGVFPFFYQGADEQYAPLARGLAELVSVDLANIQDIRVVERIRLQVILDELDLVETDYLDPATAPRVGQLLGAGRLVTGAYNVLGGDNLRIDGAYLALETNDVNPLNSQSDALRNLFVMQKALVFDLVDDLGIELTPEERQQIEFIPTENIQAFLAYSRGLRDEDAGAYGLAAGHYRRASRLDPNFVDAARRAERAEAVDAANMDIEELVAEAADIESMNSFDVDLMGIRIGILNDALGSGFIPGEESREPTTETNGGGMLLPDPPRPPTPPN